MQQDKKSEAQVHIILHYHPKMSLFPIKPTKVLLLPMCWAGWENISCIPLKGQRSRYCTCVVSRMQHPIRGGIQAVLRDYLHHPLPLG